MLIGVPKEIKNFEYRVGLVPSSARELIAHGHQVMIEHAAGEKIGFNDQSYQQVRAKIPNNTKKIY